MLQQTWGCISLDIPTSEIVISYGSSCEFEWTPGDGDGQGGLACCDSWGRKESNTTKRLNWTELNWSYSCALQSHAFSSVQFCGAVEIDRSAGHFLKCKTLLTENYPQICPWINRDKVEKDWGFPGGPSGEEPACQGTRHKRRRFNPWVRKIPWGRHGNPLQCSYLENPMDRGA